MIGGWGLRQSFEGDEGRGGGSSRQGPNHGMLRAGSPHTHTHPLKHVCRGMACSDVHGRLRARVPPPEDVCKGVVSSDLHLTKNKPVAGWRADWARLGAGG